MWRARAVLWLPLPQILVRITDIHILRRGTTLSRRVVFKIIVEYRFVSRQLWNISCTRDQNETQPSALGVEFTAHGFLSVVDFHTLASRDVKPCSLAGGQQAFGKTHCFQLLNKNDDSGVGDSSLCSSGI